MQKVTYSQAVKDAVVEKALDARNAGKTWSETCLLAKTAGFKGSVSSLQKLVSAAKANVVGALKPAQAPGNKGPAKALKSGATGANAFKKTEGVKSAAPSLPILKNGRKYQRPISLFNGDFRLYGEGEIEACSHIDEKEEVLRLVNSNPAHPRGGDVVVDCTLSPAGSVLTVVLNSAQTRNPNLFIGTHPVGTQVPVQRRWDGTTYVSIRDVGPNETLILTNLPQAYAASVRQ